MACSSLGKLSSSNDIEVLDASEWRVGDEIVLASTDFNPRQARWKARRSARIPGRVGHRSASSGATSPTPTTTGSCSTEITINANGFTHASGAFGRYEYTSKVVDSLFVGETENIGNPRTEEEIAYGRSLPKPSLPDFPIRGYEYYEYRHDIENTTFVNFEDNDTRKTGAISNLLYSSFGVSTNNAFEDVDFVDAKPVYFPPMESRWGSDNGGSTSYTTAAYRDRDGSLGRGPDSYVLIHDGVNDSIAVDNVRAGTEITVTTERPTVSLTLNEMDEGSWVMFELPGFTTAASGTQQNSLDALRMASALSYFQDQDALWVKVVSAGDSRTGAPGGGTSITVNR